MQVVVCQHLGAGLVTRGVRQKRNDPDCSGSAVRCRSRASPFQVNEFYLNSWMPKIAKALVRTFELVLKGFDVIPIVAPEDGRL